MIRALQFIDREKIWVQISSRITAPEQPSLAVVHLNEVFKSSHYITQNSTFIFTTFTMIAVITVGINVQVLETLRSLAFLQVVQKAKQWWFVRNSRNEEGNVPQSVLEPMTDDRPMDDQSVSEWRRSSAE